MSKGRTRYDIALKRPGIMIPAPNNTVYPYFDVQHELSDYSQRLGVRVIVSPACATLADTQPAVLLQRICEEIRERVKKVGGRELSLSEIRGSVEMQPMPDGSLDIRWSGDARYGISTTTNPPSVIERYNSETARRQADGTLVAGPHGEVLRGSELAGRRDDEEFWGRGQLNRQAWDERLRRESLLERPFPGLGTDINQERYL